MTVLKLALPKGHLWDNVENLLNRAGYGLTVGGERSYMVKSNDPELQIRVHRAQNICPLVEGGKYDLGITGHDWVIEHKSNVDELMDLGLRRVNVVVAIPQRRGCKQISKRGVFKELAEKVKEEGRERIIVASEYENLTRDLCKTKLNQLPYTFIRSYGATETFIEVADLIVDCTETGDTLRANGWEIAYTLFDSTARIIANKKSLRDSWKKDKIKDFLTLVRGAKDAEGLKLLKMNVSGKMLNKVTSVLPAMKSPTISKLHGVKKPDYGVEVAVKEDQLLKLIPLLKKNGATDILEIDIKKVIK
ncbi:MAG: ATP phosphoribosyltransferase [Candidatus Bathyarchaeota archaeon]